MFEITNGASANHFSEDIYDGFLETETKIPPPVVVSFPSPVPLVEEHPASAKPSALDEKELIDTSGLCVRTQVGLFERLTNIVIAEGVKIGSAKNPAPLAKRDETEADEKRVERETTTTEESVATSYGIRCSGAECSVSCHVEDPWATETRCKHVSAEYWPQAEHPETIAETDGILSSRVKRQPEDTEVEIDFALLNNNNNNLDAESRFKEFIDGGKGFHAYQPSAIVAQAERPAPYNRYIPPASQCRIGGGIPGAPAATEGGRFSQLPANKAGVPWGAKKQRVPPNQKFINQEAYQVLKPSGRWTYATQMQQPSNKQAQADRRDPFPRYIAKKQKCQARSEYRKKTTDQGVASSAKAPIKRRRPPINLDAVRCNCPGLYPPHRSHGPGNYWDEEDDDEAILAEMCSGDDLEECGQGVDNVFPLEEWSDEWEDGVLSGDCVKGRLAPGTLELHPWENPCLEELYKRKARIQELRNKRWAALDKARSEAKRLKEEATEEGKKEAEFAAKELERKALNEHGQKNWSLFSWFTPTNWASAPNTEAAETNRPGKTCTTRTSIGPNACDSGNKCSNNSSDGVNVGEVLAETRRPILHPSEMADYEWDQVDETGEDYTRRMAEKQTKANIEETKRRIQRLGAEREAKITAEITKVEVPKKSGGILSFFGITSAISGSNDNNNTAHKASASSDVDVSVENANNNAANRCFKPCPPCPQEGCPPPPFECPCNDINCPKKLKGNGENAQQKKKGCVGVGGAVGNVNVCIDVTDDLQIESIDISVKKPPPDLSLGCPCGDDACKKKKCNIQPKKFGICEPSKGKMALQEACPVQECEPDICDNDGGEPTECPCTDDNCPKKTGSQEGFVFLYPPTDKIKYDDKGCPLQPQMHCVVTQIGDRPPEVAVKPMLKGLHCDPVPPCPCPEYEAMEAGSCLCSGNAWGEEIDDEENANCSKPPPKKETKSKDCGASTVEGGVTADDFEWDFWDSPCGDGEVATTQAQAVPEEIKKCQEFMSERKGGVDNRAAAMEAALEAFEYEKVRKERLKTEAETRKRRVAEMREAGLSEEEIRDQLCSERIPGPCDIAGEFPPQEICAPNPPPPGCPCPDPACPKRAPFDYQMHDMDLARIKSPYDYKNTENYLKSASYKTMDCELKRPTYKDLTKSYPKRTKTKCPCPDCVGDAKKAWAEVEKLKIGPPPECPCTDPKCPKKPIKEEKKKEEDEAEDLGPCAMKTYYPAQSGCPEVLRCDLIRDVCGSGGECDKGPRKKPEARYMCHACSLRSPMPKQAACPDYDCKSCRLVCHKCGCRPRKCDKCEAEHASKNKEKPATEAVEPCPPCAVKGPLPTQSDCKKIHPCDEEHPCMCDPNTGEPIEPERCGPCDTKHHDFFPPQGGCDYAVAITQETCRENSPKMSLIDVNTSNSAEKGSELSHGYVEDSQASVNDESSEEKSEFGVVEGDPWDDVEATLAEETPITTELQQKPATFELEAAAPTEIDVLEDSANVVEDCTLNCSSTYTERVDVEEVTTTSSIATGEAAGDEIVDDGEVADVEIKIFGTTETPPTEETTSEVATTITTIPMEEAGATTPNVKVRFREVSLELTDDQLRQVNEAFERQEAEEVAARRDIMERELKVAALLAVNEKIKKKSPPEVEDNKTIVEPEPEDVETEPIEDSEVAADERSGASNSLLAYLPSFIRPKAKCLPQRRSYDGEEPKRLSSGEGEDGLNAMGELVGLAAGDWEQTGIIHRTSCMRIDRMKGADLKPEGKTKLIWVNNDGAIGLLSFD